MSAQRCATDGCGNWSDSEQCSACRSGYVMQTADRVKIVHGLAVWTNDLEAGRVDLEYRDRSQGSYPPRGEFWFYVQVPGKGRVMQSETRVTTRHPFTGLLAGEGIEEGKSE